jgi:hypothetical protein
MLREPVSTIQKERQDTAATDSAAFAKRREQMVQEQLQARDITDARVLL